MPISNELRRPARVDDGTCSVEAEIVRVWERWKFQTVGHMLNQRRDL